MTLRQVIRLIQSLGLGPFVSIALYPLRSAYHTVRSTRPRAWPLAYWRAVWGAVRRPAPPQLPPAGDRLGALRSYAVHDRTVVIACDRAAIHVTVLAHDLMRVQIGRPGETLDTFSYAVARPDDQWPRVPFAIDETMDDLQIRTERLILRIENASGRLSFLDPHRPGMVIMTEEWRLGAAGGGVCIRRLPDDERIYGLGEKAVGLDRRGRTYDMWNADPGTYPPGRDPLYINIPFYIGLREEIAHGVFYDNTYRSRMDFGLPDVGQHARPTGELAAFQTAGGPLRCYFFYGPPVMTILERYTELTGRMALPPLWALGYHQSRWGYASEQRVRQLAADFRARRIPCDVIHLDIDHLDGYRSFTWHPRRFPDPARMIAALHAQGFKVVTIVDCGIKADRHYAVCRDGQAHDVFCRYPDGSIASGPVWPGDCLFPDVTSSRVREWWGGQYRPLLEAGVDGIWNDMDEPALLFVNGRTLPDCVRHHWEGQGADHAQAHNVYGLLIARASAEGLAALRPDRRPFVLTRAGWAGLQRYAANWTGDNQSTWEHLRLTVPMVINLGLSGLAFCGPDTGGFGGTPDAELLTRWIQLGAFMPFFRNHTALATGSQEPWVHGEPYEGINRRFIELRYHLLPYIYTAFWQCSQTGTPVMRPLFLHRQDDARTWTLDDEFLLGDAMLIAPVGEAGAKGRPVYLPEGTWYDWWTGQSFTGPQTVWVDAPLDRMPIFVRAGSVIAAWPVMQHVGEQPVDVLTLHVFPGDGESLLYEDDGQSLAYRAGEYRLTRFAMRMADDGLIIERSAEGNFTPSYRQVEIAVHGVVGEGQPSIQADGRPVQDWSTDRASQVLHFRAPLCRIYAVRLREMGEPLDIGSSG